VLFVYDHAVHVMVWVLRALAEGMFHSYRAFRGVGFGSEVW
jgi:hypothetical protein